jgi:hypothetical protein
LVPGVARASGTLDQSQTDTSGGSVPITGPNFLTGPASEAQTFTAGLTGGLDRVDLHLLGVSVTGPLTVEIRDTSGGLPGSTVLASASVPASSVPTSFSWIEVDFASPAPVTSGTQYAIVAYTADTGQFGGYRWSAGNGDVYSGGAGWRSFASPPSTTWSGLTADLAFKTYVSPSASGLAAQLVTDADHLGPGHALADKAAAIQTAVNAEDTATACADITDFLGLVTAQTGKKLSQSDATELRNDATSLAAALGC